MFLIIKTKDFTLIEDKNDGFILLGFDNIFFLFLNIK